MATVGLFVPCYVSVLRPGEHRFAEQVLRALGDEVELIEGRCCGQPAYNSGFQAEAHDVGRLALREADSYEAIVVPSGSCTTMIQHYLPGLFADHEEGAQARAERFHDFASYVANHPARGTLQFRLEGVATYHDACHGRRELGLTNTIADLLASVQGLELRRLEREDECCGFGGTFSVKLPEVSRVMGQQKLKHVRATGAKVVVSGDLSCLAHLEGLAVERKQHMEGWSLAELLARALV